MDMMRQGNMFYMQYNKHMLQIEPKIQMKKILRWSQKLFGQIYLSNR